MAFRILVCISAHGFGHLAMTAPILNRLSKLYNVKLVVRTKLPESLIRELIFVEVEIINEAADFGMVMKDAFEVDLEESKKKYFEFHSDWDMQVEKEMWSLEQLQPDLILSNAPYLTIAAAGKLQIPCLGYCSLNWADIFQSYFGNDSPEARKIIHEMRNAYNSADFFILPEPSMPIEWINSVINIGPVARIGNNVKAQICERLAIADTTRLVLVAPGGIETDVPVNDWPQVENIHWIVSWEYLSVRKDVSCIKDTGFIFNDILASCDAIISKPGYGTVTDTVCNNIPALYVLRGDWAEEEFLVNWWKQKGCVEQITKEHFFSGNVVHSLESLWSRSAAEKITPSGIDEITSIISGYISNKFELH